MQLYINKVKIMVSHWTIEDQLAYLSDYSLFEYVIRQVERNSQVYKTLYKLVTYSVNVFNNISLGCICQHLQLPDIFQITYQNKNSPLILLCTNTPWGLANLLISIIICRYCIVIGTVFCFLFVVKKFRC